MRLAINAFSARLGGGQTYLTNLLLRIPESLDVEIDLFAPDDLPVGDDRRITRLRTRWPVKNPLVRALWERGVLTRFLEKRKSDVVFCPGGLISFTPPTGCRSATMFRNMLPFTPAAQVRLSFGLQKMRNLILRREMLSSMKQADLTIFISDYARETIEREIVVPNAITIPHGIAEQFRTADFEIAQPASLQGDYLLYVSRFEPYKHHREVVMAYAQLPQALRDRYQLVLAGENNYPEGDRVRAMLESMDLGSRVLLPGPVPYGELPAYYRNAALIIFASSCENCPNILLEGMGSGRPMLVSDVMPMPEFGGLDMAYFSPYDSADLAAKLQYFLEDRAHAATLAVSSRARSSKYDWAQTSLATWRALADLA